MMQRKKYFIIDLKKRDNENENRKMLVAPVRQKVCLVTNFSENL